MRGAVSFVPGIAFTSAQRQKAEVGRFPKRIQQMPN
jgi:hypothetical protein